MYTVCTNLAERNGSERFGCTGGIVGSFDHAKRRWRRLLHRRQMRFFAAVVVFAGNTIIRVVVATVRGPTTAGDLTHGESAELLVHRRRSPDAVRTSRFRRKCVAAPSGQPVLDLPVVGQPVELTGASLQKAPARRARFRRVAFRPKVVRQLPLADRVPFHSPLLPTRYDTIGRSPPPPPPMFENTCGQMDGCANVLSVHTRDNNTVLCV